jgi:hypothetical protein
MTSVPLAESFRRNRKKINDEPARDMLDWSRPEALRRMPVDLSPSPAAQRAATATASRQVRRCRLGFTQFASAQEGNVSTTVEHGPSICIATDRHLLHDIGFGGS